jgi:eukaryotic-like serine/threonine-protein kinase
VSTVPVVNHKPTGIVVAESPAAGTKADKGSTVTLSVSTGPGNVSVPTVQGLTVPQATKVLKRAGLKVSNVVQQSSGRFTAGQVTGTNPGTARSVPHGAGVTLFVSSGQPQKKVPNVLGESQTQATEDLTRAGFNVRPSTQPASSQGDVGNVISQSPSGNTNAPNGSTVTITVGTAPATTTVPAVIGDPAGGAVSALRAAGFKVNQTIRSVTDPVKNGTVIAQSPGGNSTAKKGSTITITVGQLAHTTSSSSTTTTTSTSTTRTTSSPTTPSTSTTTSQGQ